MPSSSLNCGSERAGEIVPHSFRMQLDRAIKVTDCKSVLGGFDSHSCFHFYFRNTPLLLVLSIVSLKEESMKQLIILIAIVICLFICSTIKDALSPVKTVKSFQWWISMISPFSSISDTQAIFLKDNPDYVLLDGRIVRTTIETNLDVGWQTNFIYIQKSIFYNNISNKIYTPASTKP